MKNNASTVLLPLIEAFTVWVFFRYHGVKLLLAFHAITLH